MKSPLIVKVEGWISFLIPFLSAVGGSSLLTDTYVGKVITMICLALVGGLSGLKSFLSTTFSDSMGAPDAANLGGAAYAPGLKPAGSAAAALEQPKQP